MIQIEVEGQLIKLTMRFNQIRLAKVNRLIGQQGRRVEVFYSVPNDYKVLVLFSQRVIQSFD